MNNISYTNILLTIIAVLLLSINVKIWSWPDIPRRGDIVAMRAMSAADQQKAREKYFHGMPVIWIQGGAVDVDR